jgi:hypothetical protein
LYCHLHQVRDALPESDEDVTIKQESLDRGYTSESSARQAEQQEEEYERFEYKYSFFIGPSRLRRVLVAATTTRNQVGLVVGIFVITTIGSTFLGLNDWLYVSDAAITQLYSAASQAIAALIGLLIAIRIYSIQLQQQIKSQAYDDFVAQVDKLRELVYGHSDELEGMIDDFDELLWYLGNLRMKDMPQEYNVWENEGSGIVEEIVERLRKNDGEKAVYYHHLLSTLLRMETSMDNINVFQIGHYILLFHFKSLLPLIFLLGLSLLLLLAFGTLDVKGVLPDLALPVAASFLCWLFLALLDLVFHIESVVRNFEESWGWS